MKTAIVPTRKDNYPEWYQQVISAADMAENSPTRGCMVIKPWGYAIWENIQKDLDGRIKETGHVNAYFPLLIPLSQLEKEAKHIEGFAKECAVVTHHRLKGVDGKLIPDGELEEPYVIRPTSETMIGVMYSKWVQSHRDLPILINQWANVMRWEMRTRLFLRTSEFLWQEGHTAHATESEAVDETKKMLDVYAKHATEFLAMPVIKGEKTESERFPGAVNTYCIEAMMQDGKALQAGTSHFLGQHFSKAYNIEFTNETGEKQFAFTTSWGVSTRLIGGLIMTHSDDNGLVLPPAVSPYHVVILTIIKSEEEKARVQTAAEQLKKQLSELIFKGEKLRVFIDYRDMRGGEKFWHWIKKGVPLIIELGPRDIENQTVMLCKRNDPDLKKQSTEQSAVLSSAVTWLDEMQKGLFQKADSFMKNNIVSVSDANEFKKIFTENTDESLNNRFVSCYAKDTAELEALLKSLKASARCIPLENNDQPGNCIFTGEKVDKKTIFAKAY